MCNKKITCKESKNPTIYIKKKREPISVYIFGSIAIFFLIITVVQVLVYNGTIVFFQKMISEEGGRIVIGLLGTCVFGLCALAFMNEEEGQ